MTADDVVASFRRLFDPNGTSPVRSQYDMVESVSSPEAGTVVFQLKIPYGGLADILTDRQVKIVPRKAVGHVDAADRYRPVHVRELYRRRPPRAGAPSRLFRAWPAQGRRRGAAHHPGDERQHRGLAGRRHRYPVGLAARAGEAAARPRRLAIDSVPTASWDGAILNNSIPPFNDKRVRQAFHLAIDKKDVVELTLFGQGVPTISPIPPSHPFFAKDIVVPKADPAAARKLLAEAGHPNGIKLPVILPVGRPVRERMGVTLQQLAKAGGFDLQVQRAALFVVQRRGLGQGAVVHRRVLRPPDRRHQPVPLPAQQGQLERAPVALQRRGRRPRASTPRARAPTRPCRRRTTSTCRRRWSPTRRRTSPTRSTTPAPTAVGRRRQDASDEWFDLRRATLA